MSSLFWHALWALLVAADEGVCRRHSGCLSVPYDPDVYSRVLSVANAKGSWLSGADVAAFLLTCLLLSIVAFFASAGVVRLDMVAERLRQPLYGLYADLVREAAQTAPASVSGTSSEPGRRLAVPKYVIAYVLTDMEKDGGYLGYFGVLENVQVGADKQVAGISLLDSDTFVLQIGPPSARTPGQRSQLIDRIIIGGAHIQNVAFEVVEPG